MWVSLFQVALRVAGALACRRLAEKLSERGEGEVTSAEVFRYLEILIKDVYLQKVIGFRIWGFGAPVYAVFHLWKNRPFIYA